MIHITKAWQTVGVCARVCFLKVDTQGCHLKARGYVFFCGKHKSFNAQKWKSIITTSPFWQRRLQNNKKILTLWNKCKDFDDKAVFDDDDDDEGLTHGVAVHGSAPRVSCVMLVILRAQFGGRHRLRTDHPHFTSHETRLDKNTRQRRYNHAKTHTHTHTVERTKTTRIPEVRNTDITAKHTHVIELIKSAQIYFAAEKKINDLDTFENLHLRWKQH